MVATHTGATALSLAMPAGESALIKNLRLSFGSALAEDVTVTIDRKKIIHFKGPADWGILAGCEAPRWESICDEIKRHGLFPTIPLGEGETLGITAPGVNHWMSVEYDLYDAGDITPNMPNGSKSNQYRMFQVISNSGVRATAGDLALDQSDIDAAFPAFPGGASVPANTRMELLALFGSPWSHGTDTDNGEYTTYLKLLKDREDILDKDLRGMVYQGDWTFIANNVSADKMSSPIWVSRGFTSPCGIYVFDPPVVFNAGEELNVYATLARTGAGGDFTAGQVKVGLLFDVFKG